MEQFFRRKSIFEIIREAEEDEQGGDTGSSDTAATGTEEPTTDAGEGDVEVPEDDTSGDEDFNIDTSIDDDGGEDDPLGGEGGEESGSEDSSSSDFGGGSTGGEDPEEEPIEANTDIFASLSAEEQIIKIKELKGCYNDLYTSLQDLITKVDEIDLDEYNKDTITRISSIMLKTKVRLMDYILNVFGTKSYIENDVMFNRFLSIVNSVSGVVDELAKQNTDKLA